MRFVGFHSVSLITIVLALALSGCSVEASFPADRLEETIQNTCSEQYDMDVSVYFEGETLGILHVADRLIDPTGQAMIPEFRDKISDLIMVVTRAALSTDAKVNFLVAGIRGEADMMEVRVVRYLMDIKRAQTESMSVGESMKRTIWVQSKLTEEAMDPRYFKLKDWTLEDFIAEQVVQRIKFEKEAEAEANKDKDDKKEENTFLPTELVEGRFRDAAQGRTFEFSMVSFEEKAADLNLLRVFRIANQVIYGYGFKDFDRIVIKDLLGRKTLELDFETLVMFRKKKLTEDELLDAGMKDDFSDPNWLGKFKDRFGFET